ncbi:glucosylceramide transporter ABCA12 [Heteronotia binoei]|uniref:glucosylceramide transporter ABCA12 n=1 Tax=Heteronotia binoei TaxID=13085 RepID=UPI00292E2724|nr:glucosylceramide transporter ABCA12 [Heteronotia binoei]
MASLFQHLRVLLWKNWLSVKRQPLWSLTLVTWPAITFILVAIIRLSFPPEAQPNCYLAPRNLPSAGFFPFLQTVLCNSDAVCKATPYTPEDLLPKLNGLSPIRRKRRRSVNVERGGHLSPQSADATKSRNGSLELMDAIASLKSSTENMSPSSHNRTHLFRNILSRGEMPTHQSTVANLKSGICEVLSAYASSQKPLWEALGANVYQTFCFTELSLLESFFQEFRSRIVKLQEDPQYQVTFVRETVSFLSLLSELQNETSVWRLLLLAPDITRDVIRVKGMVAALRETSRTFIDPERDFLSDASESGLQALKDMITRLLHSLNCTEPDENSSEITALCELSRHWNSHHPSLVQMKEMVSKIISPDSATADFKMGNLSKDLETIRKSLDLFKDFQEGSSTAELKNLKPLNLFDNKTILRLTDILSLQMRDDQHHKRRDLTSLLQQTAFNTSSIFQLMTPLKEIQNIYDLTRNILDLVFLSKTDFKATKLWQTLKMITSHKFIYMPEKVRRYLTALQELPSLFANSLLKPTTMENFPEKVLALQKIYDIVANVNASHNYLLISSLTNLMQKIQNSINAYQWNEFNTYWQISEKLRSAKWNDTDIIAYGQVLDILHKNLYIHRNGSGLLFNKVLEQLTAFANHLLEDYSGDNVGGANISVVLDTIVKTLHVLEDLEEKYISAFITTNPLMNADAHNETIQRLIEIFREGVDILSDPRLLEASVIKRMDNLFRFSRLSDLQDFPRTPVRPDASLVEGKVLELWYFTLSPFVREDSLDNGRLLNCTVKDFHHIAIEVLFRNTTFSEAVAESDCRFLFTSTDTVVNNQTLTEVFQLLLRNLKSLPTLAVLQKSKYFPDEFQCFVKSLELSSRFLSQLDTFLNYQNPWIQKMHKSLTSISSKLSQSNLTCQIPLFGKMAVINESSAFHILVPFVTNYTETYSQRLSASQSTQERVLASFMSLLNEPDRNASIARIIENMGGAVSHPQWKNLSAVLSKVAKVLNTTQNVTDVHLLEIIREALILVSTALSPNWAETYPFFEILNWGMNASNFEDMLESLKWFSVTSKTDYRTYLEKYFHTWSPYVDVLAQSLFRLSPQWKDTKKGLYLTKLIWNNLFLNETGFNLAGIWETVKKVVSHAISLFSVDPRHDLRSTQEASLHISNFLRKSIATKNILWQILSVPNAYNVTANVRMNKNYPFVVHLSEIMQRIQNTTKKPWWDELRNLEHKLLRSLKPNSSNPDAYRHFSKILRKHLITQYNVSGLHFSLDLFTSLLWKGAEENLQNNSISEALNTVLRSLSFEENSEHQFDISQLEALVNESNKNLQRIADTLKRGMIILSDSRLEEATHKERIAALYTFSRFLFPREFNQSLLGQGASSEAKIMDILHLSLSPFLDMRSRSGKPQNCSAQHVIHSILQILRKNAILHESFKQSDCEILFTSRDFENRTKPNQTLTELFRLTIRNLKLSPESAKLYQNEDISSTLLCIIRSLQFSSGMLSKMDILFNFKNPWIQQTSRSLAAISNALPTNNSTCLIPILDGTDDAVNYYPLNMVSSFLIRALLAHGTDIHARDFTDWLVGWNNMSEFLSALEDNVHQYSAMNEALEMAKDVPSRFGVDSLSQIWNLVSKWNLTEMEDARHGLKWMERVLVRNESSPILVSSIYVLQKAMLSDLLEKLKRDQDPNFHANKPNMEYVFKHIAYRFATVTEMLFNENLLQNESGKTSSPSTLIAQFLFSEFENTFFKMLPNNGYRSYLLCLVNMTDGLNMEFSEDVPLNTEQLEKILFAHHDSYKKYSSVPEILTFRLSRLQNVTSALCDSERLQAAQQSCQLPKVSFGDLCRQSRFHRKLLHGIALNDQLVSSLIRHRGLPRELREMLLGDPTKLQQEIHWFRENVPQLHYIQDIPQYVASVNSIVNHTKIAAHSKKQDMIIDLFRNVGRLKEDLRTVVGMSEESRDALLEMPLPENRTELLFEMLQLESCRNGGADAKLEIVAKDFCNLSLPERVHKSYLLGITLLRYLDVYNFMYKMLFPKELQSSLDKVFGLLQELDHFKNRVESDVQPLLDAIHSLKKLRQSRNAPLSKALSKASSLTMDRRTFKTISKSLCNQEITPLFFESLLPDFEEQNVHHSSTQDEGLKHIMEKYGIPQDSTPFCLSFYLDLVRTPTGALIWSFLKPMLLGKILYTPDTPETRAIMGKSNSTLKLMGDLAHRSQEWLENSPLIMNSLTTLNQTIPLLKNTLRNPFVQVFIKLMVKLDAIDILTQINRLDDIRLELQNNADIISQLDTLSELMTNVSSCVLFDRIKPARSVDELETMAKQLFLKNELFASIIFRLPSDYTERNGTNRRNLSLPPLVNYTIRMSSKISQTTKRIREKIWTVGPHNSASQSQIYSRAFVYVQDSLERAIIELQTGKRLEDLAVQVQGTPYPCYSKDMFLTSVTYSLPFTLMAAWVLFIAAFVKKLVQEKDLRLYEYMKMMGVNSSSHFFAWFVECASFLLITVTFLILILKVGNILPQSNVVILFLYLTNYSFSIIAMCYLISVFFNNTNIAALVGSLVYILTFFPFIVLLVVENHVSFSVKSLLSLLSPTAFSYASQYIARYEEQGVGLQWHNVYKSPMTGDNTNFGWMCWLILIDSFIYFILGWYIRNVFPGKYGMAAPWYFPLLPSYWAERYGYIPLWDGKSGGLPFASFFWRKEPVFPEKMYVQSALPSNLEPQLTNLPVGVSLHGITKFYGSKAAVQNLNLKFYEGNITSLLGHNGAGKTTTISILTGLFPASSGTIFVYGKDIRTDQDTIRKDMGICMQHNVLFSYLTTKEHLLLYGNIKVPHWSKQELLEEVDRTLKETGLYNHRHKLAGSLSGGMKRKLSISIALLGGSRVVILDEPTTGVDPCSRRGIWEIISKNRKGRTIILSTHHLDEAEVLSDRIVFLENGGLKCCGSPFYLKETFGSGYHLTLTKKKSPAFNLAEECDTSAVTAMIQSHLPAAYLKEDIGGELVYVLPPFNSRVSPAYQSLLKSLDNGGASDLQIGCYGISDSTVEEVFLNLTKDLSKGEQADSELPQEVPASCPLENDEMSVNSDTFTERDDQALVKSKKRNNFCVLLRKATALFVKRFHHTRRNVKGFIAQVILPVLFVTAAMGLGTLRTEVAEYPALHLSPSLYGDSGQADFFGNYNKSTEPLVASLLAFPGVDNTCLNRSNPGCFKEKVPGEWLSSGNQSAQYFACNCTDIKQTCPQVDFTPPHKRTFSSRTIYNLTGHDVEAYLLITAKEFVQKRYGGWSFGMPLTSDLQFDINPVPANRTLTKVWYNPEGYHSLPAYLNSLNNFILRANLPKEKSSNYGISVVAHPYPGGESQEQLMLSSLLDIIVSMSVLIGYSITTASFVLYVVKEHQNKAKQLQHISGLGVTTYWVTNFIYDLTYFMVPVALSIGVISAFQIPAFYNDSNLLAVFLLLFLFGYATFSWMYLLAGIFKETGMAFIVYVCINLFFGINTIITQSVVFLLSQEKATDQGLHNLAETLRHVFLMFPQFCFGNGLIELSQHQALMGFLKAYGVVYPDKTFELDRISCKLLGLFLQGTLFFSIRLVVDDGTIQKVWYKILEFLYDQMHGKLPLQLEAAEEEEDKDVLTESERVAAGRTDYDMLQLQNLTKIYHLPHRRIVAVRNVSIGIPAGECFGLLGVNGAGKTTIFKMLTGDIGPSHGRLLVRDENGFLTDVDKAHWSLFGYCPQEDALDDLLTVEEHMYYYARLLGIPEKHIKGIVLQLLYRLNLVPYRQRITSMCSYGTNRKLSTALALLGRPSILLLDEPSSGMDPNAKRHLWKIISEEVQNQCSVVLTSHSMEECEALCTRLAIMVNGSFQCLGSLQHIKSRFGKGFTVKMHLNNGAESSIEKLTQFMQSNFPNTHLKDHQLNMVEYHVLVSAGGVANIFQLLEASKAVFKIRHFSVSQTTLEEVFINFARHQTSPDAPEGTSEHSNPDSGGSPMAPLF